MPHPVALPRFAAALALAVLAAGSVPAASPRDELLRLAPQDAALVLVVQNARDHVRAASESPFAEWFPSSGLGRLLLAGGDFGKARTGATAILGELGTNPEELLDDVLGDAVAFAYTPGPPDRPGEERAVFLIRP